MSSLTTIIARQVGLDEESVRQQILPHLETLTSRHDIVSFLTDLLGSGQTTTALAHDYIDQRQLSRAPPVKPNLRKQSHPSQNQSRPPSKAAELHDVVDSLPLHYQEQLAQLDGKIASLKYSPASSEAGVSKRQLKKYRLNSCFCGARHHPLSEFTPLCPGCALLLCHLQAPLLPCPSCAYHPLLSSSSRSSHLERLSAERAALTDRIREELRTEPERFPELTAARNRKSPVQAPPQTRTVLSLGPGGTVTRTVTRPATGGKSGSSKRRASSAEQPDDPMERPFVDPDDDAFPATRRTVPVVEGRYFANPFWRDGEQPVYKPASVAESHT